MFEHRSALGVRAHLKNVVRVLLPVGAPVVLRRLEGSVHLVNPCRRKCRIPAACREHASSAVKSAGLASVLPCDIDKTVRSRKRRHHHVVLIVVDIGDIPCKAETISVVLALRHIGGPLLGKCLRVYKILLHKRVEPLDPFLVAFLHRCIDHFSVVCHREMIAGISIAFAKAVDQDRRILVAVVDDKRHGDHIALDIKFLFKGVRVIAECDQRLLQFICRGGHIKTEEVQPLLINIRNIADGLDCFLAFAQLFDPRERVDMPVRRSDHGPVLRIFLKHSLKVRHIFVDQVFQRDDDALLCIPEQIIVVHARRKKSVRKVPELRQRKIFLICKLVVHKTRPVDMYIGLLLQPLEDQFLVGLLRGRRRSACDKRKLFRLLERKCYLFDRGIRVCIRNLRVSAAAPEQGQCQYEGQTQPGQSLDFIFHRFSAS